MNNRARREPSRRDWFRIAGVLLADRLFSKPAAREAFTDVTSSAGLGNARNVFGSPDNKQTLLEEMGGGVALFDFDNDGWLDIFLVNGSTFRNQAGAPKPVSYLFRNNRDGTFTDVTRSAGLTHSGWGQACCAGDYDNDGFDDLFVSYWGRNVLYHNNGDGTFTDVSEKAGVAGVPGRWGAGCCFLDYDRDGFLDLFVSSYVNLDPARAPRVGQSAYCRYSGIPVPCGPQGFAGGINVLYRNRGNGSFEDVSEKAGVTIPRGSSTAVFIEQNWRPTGSYGMGVASADFDNDGWPDIYVACDTAPSLLYRNNRDGTFREIAVPAGCAFDENGTALSGMGVGVGDYDGDGWFDIVRTNFSDQVTTLYHSNRDGTFRDASLIAGLGVNRKYVGFGVGFLDFDRDGWKDIFIANGHVYSQLLKRKIHLTYRQRRILYRNRGDGRFEDVSRKAGSAIMAEHVGRGCAFGDLDNDGDIDIVVNNLDAPPSVLRNDEPNRNHWLMVKCVGARSNRSAIGARVTIFSGDRAQFDEVMSGSSYYSQSDLRLHFGLGPVAKVDKLEVRWPLGTREAFENPPVDHLIVIREGGGIVRTQRFGTG